MHKTTSTPKVKQIGKAPSNIHALHTMDKQLTETVQSVSKLRPNGAGPNAGKYGHSGLV